MSELESGRLETDPGSQMKVVRNEFGGTETYVKSEIYGRWFWLKVENQAAYLGASGDERREMTANPDSARTSILYETGAQRPVKTEERFKEFEKGVVE